MFESFNLDYWIGLVNGLDTVYLYGLIFLVGYLENCVPPIPGDMVTVIAAGMVGTGRLDYLMTFTVATAGNLSGFMTMYHVGRLFGRDFFIRRNFKFFPIEQMEKTEAWFQKYGYRIILFNRFLSGLRSVISLFAGMTRLQRRKIIPLALASAFMWDGILIYAGYVVGDNWKEFEEILGHYNKLVFGIIGFVVVVLVARWFLRKSSKDSHEPSN